MTYTAYGLAEEAEAIAVQTHKQAVSAEASSVLVFLGEIARLWSNPTKPPPAWVVEAINKYRMLIAATEGEYQVEPIMGLVRYYRVHCQADVASAMLARIRNTADPRYKTARAAYHLASGQLLAAEQLFRGVLHDYDTGIGDGQPMN